MNVEQLLDFHPLLFTGYPRQDRLEKALTHSYTTEDLDAALAHARRIGRSEGIDKMLKVYDIDVIIGPAESAMPSIAAASGMKTPTSLTYNYMFLLNPF